MFRSSRYRAVIIGAGRVGSHCAMSLVFGHLASEVILVDASDEFAEAQAADLADFACGVGSSTAVRAGSYDDCDDASFVIVAAGRGRRPGETRLELLNDTLGTLSDVAEKLARTSFDGMLICITNPVDIATEYLRRKTGLPERQVCGTGTSLDTIRLKLILSGLTGIDVGQIQGFCLGEHGDSSLVAWSHVSFGGVPLGEYLSARPQMMDVVDLDCIQDKVHTRGAEIISGKGCTEFGVGSVVTDIIAAITNNETRILPLSVHLNGEYGEYGICAGTPCVVGPSGVEHVLELKLTAREASRFRASCKIIRSRLEEIGLG